MHQMINKIIERCKPKAREADWPKHSLFCECRRCVRSQIRYIIEMRKAFKE